MASRRDRRYGQVTSETEERLAVPFASEPERISIIIDPDGQNQGPD
jgi:hypothetical protein